MEVFAYKSPDIPSIIDQTGMHRDWMNETFDRHAYQCFPVSMANRLGWSISFDEDISFIWDGTTSSQDGHIKIIRGGDYVSTRRANNTVSFDTGIIFSPEYNMSILTMPPPNVFIDGMQCMSTIISTSAIIGPIPIAVMVTRPNVEIAIKSGTPIATLLPLSLTELNSFVLKIKNGQPSFMQDAEWNRTVSKRGEASQKMNSRGEWTHFYRDAVDADGNKLGEHEVKKISMRVINED